MTGTLTELAVAAAAMLILHFGVSSTSLRPALVGRLGEKAYTGLFSVAALVAIVWLAIAFNRAPVGPMLWGMGIARSIVPLVANALACVLLVAALTMRNPTAIGADAKPNPISSARGASRITRHPMLWAIGLWGVSHLAANGSLRAVILFGSLTVLALVGTILIDRKGRRREPDAYARFEGETSNLPFLAIVTGRQSLTLALREIGPIRALAALALFAAIVFGHAWAFGVPAYPATF